MVIIRAMLFGSDLKIQDTLQITGLDPKTITKKWFVKINLVGNLKFIP